MLRIEDTDTARTIPGATDYIKESLTWLGIKWDDEVLVQSERSEIYKKYALELVEKGFAYYAFDDKESLEKLRGSDPNKPVSYNAYTRERMKNSLTLSKEEVDNLLSNGTPYVIRFKVEKNKEISFTDTVRGKVTFNSNNVDDKVLIKENGGATYFLANTLDDILSGVNHVIKGNEWLSSAPIIIMLYEALGFPLPEFSHLPLVLDDGKKKISKRNHKKYTYPIFPLTGSYVDEKGDAFAVIGLRESGYLKEAVINAMILVGWTPKGNTDILTLDEIIEQFDLSDIHKSDAVFSGDKLKFLNKEHLKRKHTQYLYNYIDTGNIFDYDSEKLKLIADIALERSTFAYEFNSAVDYFFKDVDYTNIKSKNRYMFMKFADKFLELTEESDFDSKETVSEMIDFVCAATEIEKGKIMPDLRNALCGGKSGAGLNETMFILGKEETRNRISDYYSYVSIHEKSIV